MNPFKRPRPSSAVAAAFCAGLLGYAYFAQFVQGYEPCPLCIFQRVGVILVGLFCLAAAIHGPGVVGRRTYGGLAASAAIGGAVVAGRHVWLQSLPEDARPACGPGLDYLLDVFPVWEAVRMAFAGSGECANVDWMLFGLSMPGWVLICFIGLAAFTGWNGFRRV